MKQHQKEDELFDFLLQMKIGWPVFVVCFFAFGAFGLYQALNVKKIYRLHVPIISHLELPDHQKFLLMELENRWLQRAGNEYFDYYLTRDIYDRTNADKLVDEIVAANKNAVERSVQALEDEVSILTRAQRGIELLDQQQGGSGLSNQNMVFDRLLRIAKLQMLKTKLDDNEPVISIMDLQLFLPEQDHREFIDYAYKPYMIEDLGPSRLVTMLSSLAIGIIVSGFISSVYVFVKRRIEPV